MPINEERLRKAIKVIGEKPKNWDQSTWGTINEDMMNLLMPAQLDEATWGPYYTLPEGVTCGTSMCLAGQVVSQAGFPLLWAEGDNDANYCLDPATNKRVPVEEKARDLLGLTVSQANRVFAGEAARYDAVARDGADEDAEITFLEEDDLDLFKSNITFWTGVEFPAEPEPRVVKVTRANAAARAFLPLEGLARKEDDLFLATVDEAGVITLVPAVLEPKPKGK